MTRLGKAALILSSALTLAACGGGGGHPSGEATSDTNTSGASSASLVYSYPANGQTEVAAPAPVVLRFTRAVNSANGITLHQGDASGALVATTAELAPDGKGVILTPTDPLQAHQNYTVVVSNLALTSGTLNKTIHFTTRASQEGPKSLVVENSTFKLARHFPDNRTQQPVMDFSTFRLQFTQPIDPSTAHYGLPTSGPTGSSGSGSSGSSTSSGTANTVALVDQNGDLVPATLIVDGPYLTLDPKPDYLNPGQKYTLTLGTGLASTFGKTLAQADDLSFTPQDSTPNGEKPAVLVQHITDARNGSVLSPLTGAPVNVVAVKGTLLGENGINATQADAVVHAELADPVTYTDVLPIRIPKGTVLTGSSIDVKIGGAVDAGYDSGKVTMTLLSDATGDMVLNPYSQQTEAPRIVHLFMDVGITTEDPRANGGFTQNLLHIELVGTAQVDTQAGVLDLDAISVVQPDVLGQEYGYAVLSFQLKSYRDQTTAPAPVADHTPPKVQSWTFGTDQQTGLDKTAMLQPTDPLIINFDKPLDPQSVPGHVHLIKNEGGTQTEMAARVTVDGAAIVIKPKEALQHPEETGPSITYAVKLDSGIADITGNVWNDTFDQTFGLATLTEMRQPYDMQGFASNSGFVPDGDPVPVQQKSAYVMGLYPGFPCALDASSLDLANGQEGRCQGGIQPHDVPAGYEQYALSPDDIIPLPEMPANRPIIVVTSSPLDPETVVPGRTFQVNEVDASGTPGDAVPGHLDISGDTLKFTPDSPWKQGVLYRYRLVSNGDMTSSSAQCDPALAGLTLCDQQGLPLNTQLLPETLVLYEPRSAFDKTATASHTWTYETKTPAMAGGGPDLIQYFKGAPKTDTVLQLLRISSTDSNHDLTLEKTAEVGSVPYIGSSGSSAKSFGYALEETAGLGLGKADYPGDPNTAGLVDNYGVPLDPGGVLPPPNSAKVLSTVFGIDSLTDGQRLFDEAGLTFPDSGYDGYIGANIGCAYESFAPWEDQSAPWESEDPDRPGCDTNYFVGGYGTFAFGSLPQCYSGQPKVCPQDKFTYMSGVLFAEITDDFDPAHGIVAYIYPGQITSTSFDIFLKAISLRTQDYSGGSGPQLMRMRYQADGGLIPAYIAEGTQGPELSASVNLYLDAFRLTGYLEENIVERASHNQHSYPVSMSLAGPVQFLSDGRMVIDQFNKGPVTVKVRGNVPSIFINLMIPEHDAHLRYISEPIK